MFGGVETRSPGRLGPQGFLAEGASAPFAGEEASAQGDPVAGQPAHAFVRPHDLEIPPRGSARRGGIDAHVRRVIVRGASVRVELGGEAGPLEAELEHKAWHSLGLREGDGVTVVPKSWRAFALSQ